MSIRRNVVKAGIAAATAIPAASQAAETDTRPNIIWIIAEDICPDLSCYGVKGVHTPNLDKLASQGARFENAYTTAPVCSSSRSAMMTGFHQNRIGCGQHRTENRNMKPLPDGILPIPNLLEDAGYFTCLMDHKTDINFKTTRKLFMGKDWKERKPGQPFYAQVSLHSTHRIWHRDPKDPIDENKIEVPPYYPDLPLVRRDIANGLEQIQRMDREVTKILKRLDDEGLSDNTLVFFIGDHGRCQVRAKQFLYEEGLHIPLLMRWPGKVKPNTVRSGLVTSLDICATILDAAGVTPPVPLQGISLLNPESDKQEAVFAARDKMDDTHDAMRSIRTKDYRLILNLMPERPWCQYNWYKEARYPVLALLNVMNAEGKLTPEQAAFMADHKPPVELYNLKNDPYEMHNLADDPEYADVKKELLAKLDDWRKNVILDKPITDEFRNGGWPAVYPTRTLQEWKDVLELWKPWVFRGPAEKVQFPKVPPMGTPVKEAIKAAKKK